MDSEKLTALFTTAVRDRRDAMFHTAMTYVKSPSDAEDAVSEAIEMTWRHLDSIRNPEAIPAYLMRSTINACHGQLRRRKREISTEDTVLDQNAVSQDAPLWEYLGQLPEKFRIPLLLRYGDGIPEMEIASILRMRRGTVSSRLARGLQMLREQMREEE